MVFGETKAQAKAAIESISDEKAADMQAMMLQQTDQTENGGNGGGPRPTPAGGDEE